MVSSKINDEINYLEKKTIDPEDIGYQSSIYEAEIAGLTVEIVIGKEKYTFMKKNVIYYPIYIFAGDTITSQIGLYEIDANAKLSILDEDGDVDITKVGEPLLYSFATPEYIKKATSGHVLFREKSDKYENDDSKSKKEQSDENDDETELSDEDEEESEEKKDEDDDTDLKLPIDSLSKNKVKADGEIKQGIFTIDKNAKMPATLQEETLEIAEKMKSEYKASSHNVWIANFLKNNNYNIVQVESNGDCFFATIREAFHQIGHKTTVQQMRALLSTELTDEIFQEKRKLFVEFESEIERLVELMNSLNEMNRGFKKRIKTVTSKSDRDEIIIEVNKIGDLGKQYSYEISETKKLQARYIGYMRPITSLEKYREYVQTNHFWADAWAISTLERLLQIKMIILSKEAYDDGAPKGVMNCGEINKELEMVGETGKAVDFTPKFYIMTSYSGNHYQLVTYKHKRIFSFSEIPYGIKMLIVDRCLEKNSGIYHLIQDFRNFKSKLGVDSDEEDEDEEEPGDHNMDQLYKKEVTLMFFSKSEKTALPGKGSHETIQTNRILEFLPLSKIENWRLKLDDSWSDAQFTVDHHKWASVEHYLQGAKYKKGFPDFYVQFSLDSGSEISTDLATAKAAGESGKLNGKILRPKGVKVDVDYKLGRDIIEREAAVKAKFTQNEDMKQLLLATNDALLNQYISRKPPAPDTILMKIRADVRSAK